MPKDCLIGHTGFIGGNLAVQHTFDECYNSRSIESIRGRSYDLLVCCGVTAVKWQANRNPPADRAAIDRLLDNLQTVQAGRVVLISTVDVYSTANDVDESCDPHGQPNHPYGVNRLYVEDSMRQLFENLHIVRLPGVFGPGLKKNVVYDLLHDNCLEVMHPHSAYQYYDVRRLWDDLKLTIKHGLSLVNFATGPIETREIVGRYFPGKAIGSPGLEAAAYDMRTLHAALFGGVDGYIYSAGQVLDHLGVWLQTTPRGASA